MTDGGPRRPAWPRRRSLRTRLVLLVSAGVFLPLIFLAAWTTRRLQHAGEELLRTQLETTVAGVGAEMEAAWEQRRGTLLLLAENEVTRRALADPGSHFGEVERRFLERAFALVQDDVDAVVFRDATGAARWRVAPDPGLRPHVEPLGSATQVPASRLGAIALDVPVTSAGGTRELGTMSVLLHLRALLPAVPLLRPAGASFDVVDSRLGVSLLAPLRATASPAPGLTAPPRNAGGEGDWLTVRHPLSELPLILIAGAPVRPYVAPFAQSARGALAALLAALLVTVALVALLVTRATRALAVLADAADAVARGDLEGQVPVKGNDELGRLATAFNAMTHELRRTLRQAAERRALAAVGNFAAELAHEVRNPLTSVQLDLQRLDESLPPDAPGREQLRRALAGVERLNRTVTGSLRIARSGSVTLRPVPLDTALEPARQTVLPQFAARGVALEHTGDLADASVCVRGDPDALAQLFANLLLNALEAVDDGGRVSLGVARQDGDVVVVTIADTGPGMPASVLQELSESEPTAITTKRGGTGLGLRIASRIVEAHGGQLRFGEAPGWGTVVRVVLPTTALVD